MILIHPGIKMKPFFAVSSLVWGMALLPVAAQEEAMPATPSAAAVAPAAVQHPLFRAQLYPSWSAMTPKQAIADTEAAVLLAEQRLAELCALTPQQMTFRNTFLAYGEAVVELEQTQQYLHHLIAVKQDPTLQKVQAYLMGALMQFDAQLMQNERIWQVIKTASEQPWVQELSPQQKRIVDQTLLHFIHSGAALTPQQKERKAAINLELGRLAMQYGRNVQESTAAWYWVVTDPAELRGVHPSRLAAAQADALAKGFATPEKPAWLISHTGGLAMDVVASCHVAETRRKCWEGMQGIGAGAKYDNAPIIARMMELRHEYAQLIGYKNYADLKAATRMMKDGQAALDFVNGLMRDLKPAFDKENELLLEYMSQLMQQKVTRIAPWDERKYASMMAGEHFAFNTASVRPYLEKERVLQGLFALCEKLYGVTYKELPTACVPQAANPGYVEVWAPGVKCFAVHDAATGQHLGSFYMDLHARAGKRPGAWCMPLRMGNGAEDAGVAEPHTAALMANFSPAQEGQAVLLSHPELQILFHEFGHMMHYMLGHPGYRRHCSPSVAWDFAELPSQFLENWAWQPEVLATFAYHYETGEPIPQESLQKLAASRYFMPANHNMRSLRIAKLDLELHMHYEEHFAGKDLDAAAAEMLAEFTPPFSVTAPCAMRNLLHCFQGGYAAGYYSYKWSETLAADAFLRFRQDGLFNAETGAAYRKAILEPGDSRPAAELFRDFMGRDVNPDALLKSQNLK
ncbi:MAG: M3 family metallopeptidase [Akkermansiaceae bacterium]|nr:M3 family metallopeptidase [Akkermansiaceae bacterium]